MRPTTLYRHYDQDGVLLYVGIALKSLDRQEQHAAKSHWWSQIATIRLEQFPSYHAATVAEKKAIVDEKPIFNSTHSKDPLRPKRTFHRYIDELGRPRVKCRLVYPDPDEVFGSLE